MVVAAVNGGGMVSCMLPSASAKRNLILHVCAAFHARRVQESMQGMMGEQQQQSNKTWPYSSLKQTFTGRGRSPAVATQHGTRACPRESRDLQRYVGWAVRAPAPVGRELETAQRLLRMSSALLMVKAPPSSRFNVLICNVRWGWRTSR